jgi:sialate O-acetylesterase
MPGQVLQRNKKNRAEARITGACEAAGVVEARVRKGARNLPGLNWRRTGRAKDGKFECRLSGIPAGGPYTLQLRISGGKVTSEALTVKPIFVGDVWFMGGQSNMQGIGNMEDAPRPRPMVRCFYMRDEWDAAKDPLHFLAEAVDAVHLTLSGISQPANPEQLRKERAAAQKGVGVGVFFGIEMFRRTRVPQGLVACGHGGTSMSQWSPQKKGEGGNSLYGAMLRRYRKLAQPAAGVLWYQGESDAGVEGYTKRMEELVSSVREDFGLPRLPWVVVQIGRVVGTGGDGTRSRNSSASCPTASATWRSSRL